MIVHECQNKIFLLFWIHQVAISFIIPNDRVDIVNVEMDYSYVSLQFWVSRVNTYAKAYFSTQIHEEAATRRQDHLSALTYLAYSLPVPLLTVSSHMWTVRKLKLCLQLRQVAEAAEPGRSVDGIYFRFAVGLHDVFGSRGNR